MTDQSLMAVVIVLGVTLLTAITAALVGFYLAKKGLL